MRYHALPAGLLALTALLCSAASTRAQAPLERVFESPPQDARPMTWWHWMNGNITKKGITADLEAMKRIGLGGAQIFNVSQGEPAGPVLFMSPEWRALTKHAVTEANRLGLRLAIHNCAGWSESGGPWITPELSMQRVVWTETTAAGGALFRPALKQPTANHGFYRDIAVLAFPKLPGDGSMRIPDIQARSGVVPNAGLTFSDSRIAWPQSEVVPRSRIVDLTARLQPDGHVDWTPPAGEWTVLRIGHTSTGQPNAPAPDSGRGLECDKMSRTAVQAHFQGMMAQVIADAGPLAGRSLKYMLADSWEAGTQNWTPDFPAEFRKRMGYDITPWLPTLTGRVVDGLDQSERFLWDFRRVIADLIAENHYALLRELCAAHNMEFTAEAPGIGMPTIADELQCKGMTDMPMGEFWLDGHNDSKEAAVSAHIYSKRRASAEAFTAVTRDAKWTKAPYDHKAIGDLNFCRGINLFVFHRYAMQPWLDRVPGMTMGPWGTNFERTNTWWEQASAWMQYLSRSQALLQQGLFVADACYYYGEGAPNTIVPDRDRLSPRLPAEYDFDVCDTTVLVDRMKVENGRLVLPDGMSYRVLVLPDSIRLTPRVLEKIRTLVTDGATVVGPRPLRSPSLAGYPQCDDIVKRLADQIWGDVDGKTVFRHDLGQGHVIWGVTMAEALRDAGTAPDVQVSGDSRIVWIHRRVGSADLYFVSSQEPFATGARVSFRVSDRRPELWFPDTGRIVGVAAYTVKQGRTEMPLRFDPAGSVFVVFRRPAAGADPIVALQQNGRDALLETDHPDRGTLTIESAVYGANPEQNEGSVDVTSQLRAMVHGGRLATSASNDIAGDPAVNIVKRMRIVYNYNGRRGEVTVEENGPIEIPSRKELGPEAKPEPPAPEVAMTADGHYRLTVSEPGVYTLRTAGGKERRMAVEDVPAARTVTGPWEVHFPPNWGAPDHIAFDTLVSWTNRAEEGVQHFSGTASYIREIELPALVPSENRSLWLDLGTVKEVAEVWLNGRHLGILWRPPFRVDLTPAAKPGSNRLEVRITNLWPNRLIGDAALPPAKRHTFAIFQPYKATDPLLESGLLGPVTLFTTQTTTVR